MAHVAHAGHPVLVVVDAGHVLVLAEDVLPKDVPGLGVNSIALLNILMTFLLSFTGCPTHSTRKL